MTLPSCSPSPWLKKLNVVRYTLPAVKYTNKFSLEHEIWLIARKKYLFYLLNQTFDSVVHRVHLYQQSFGKLDTFHAIQATEQYSFHGIYAENKIDVINYLTSCLINNECIDMAIYRAW